MGKSLLVLFLWIIFFLPFQTRAEERRATWWQFQSIDTMKYSRDLSRERLFDPDFDAVIDKQTKNIAATGATHIAIATPYDEEFFPMLERWIAAARRYKLSIWFRGNWSGWEGWFDYPKISRDEHIKKTVEFIEKHHDIFEDNDVFSACPECENGGPGDPRHNDDVEGHRRFLIEEYGAIKRSFEKINKNVIGNYNSMNGDVAKLVMDKKTTRALDGVVVVDHYVKTPADLIADIQSLASSSGGRIVLGEFGVPIDDIHGEMDEKTQRAWVKSALSGLVSLHEVVGVNYWANMGSSTEIWNSDGNPRQAVAELTAVYRMPIIYGVVKDVAGFVIAGAKISLGNKIYFSDNQGNFQFAPDLSFNQAHIKADRFISKMIPLSGTGKITVVLDRENESLFFRLIKFFSNLFISIIPR